jgi:hypothetical protein
VGISDSSTATHTFQGVHHILKALASAAAAQDGVISRADALANGATSVQVHRWVHSGRLEALGPRALVSPAGSQRSGANSGLRSLMRGPVPSPVVAPPRICSGSTVSLRATPR